MALAEEIAQQPHDGSEDRQGIGESDAGRAGILQCAAKRHVDAAAGPRTQLRGATKCPWIRSGHEDHRDLGRSRRWTSNTMTAGKLCFDLEGKVAIDHRRQSRHRARDGQRLCRRGRKCGDRQSQTRQLRSGGLGNSGGYRAGCPGLHTTRGTGQPANSLLRRVLESSVVWTSW